MLKNKVILVVDDEKEVRNVISDYLKRKKFEVHEAGNGLEAINLISQIKPNLIILDEIMPEMDGFTFLGKLRAMKDSHNIPVIMLTQKSDPDSLERGITLKTDFYLPKPFKLDNLLSFINIILDNGV